MAAGSVGGVVRAQVLSDEDWLRLEPLMPLPNAKGGRPWSDHRRIVEGIIWRYRCGAPWRDLPAEFGPWQTVWRRHRQFAADGTWDKVHVELLKQADGAGRLAWDVAVDSTVNRAHQHGTNLSRTATTGGRVE